MAVTILDQKGNLNGPLCWLSLTPRSPAIAFHKFKNGKLYVIKPRNIWFELFDTDYEVNQSEL